MTNDMIYLNLSINLICLIYNKTSTTRTTTPTTAATSVSTSLSFFISFYQATLKPEPATTTLGTKTNNKELM